MQALCAHGNVIKKIDMCVFYNPVCTCETELPRGWDFPGNLTCPDKLLLAQDHSTPSADSAASASPQPPPEQDQHIPVPPQEPSVSLIHRGFASQRKGARHPKDSPKKVNILIFHPKGGTGILPACRANPSGSPKALPAWGEVGLKDVLPVFNERPQTEALGEQFSPI